MIMPHAVPSCERGRVENTSTAFFRSHGYRIPLLAGLAGWQALRYVRIFFIRVSLRPSVFVFGGTRRGDEVSRPNLLAREARSLRLGYTARTYGKAGLWGGVWGNNIQTWASVQSAASRRVIIVSVASLPRLKLWYGG